MPAFSVGEGEDLSNGAGDVGTAGAAVFGAQLSLGTRSWENPPALPER